MLAAPRGIPSVTSPWLLLSDVSRLKSIAGSRREKGQAQLGKLQPPLSPFFIEDHRSAHVCQVRPVCFRPSVVVSLDASSLYAHQRNAAYRLAYECAGTGWLTAAAASWRLPKTKASRLWIMRLNSRQLRNLRGGPLPASGLRSPDTRSEPRSSLQSHQLEPKLEKPFAAALMSVWPERFLSHSWLCRPVRLVVRLPASQGSSRPFVTNQANSLISRAKAG